MIYIFDIDGTITPPRAPMDALFAEQFLAFCMTHTVYLATGSDRNKMEGQVPAGILQAASGIFTCGGSVFEAGGKTIYSHDHEYPDEMINWLDQRISQSTYPDRFGRHIEYRTGQLNMSVVGRSASKAQRKAYNMWDMVHRERASICDNLKETFPDYEASAGGQISIDIAPAGWNKSRVIVPIQERHGDVAITFVGDRIMPGGNDWEITQTLRALSSQHVIVPIADYLETAKFLDTLEPSSQPLSA
jgi:phosphomannomutase